MVTQKEGTMQQTQRRMSPICIVCGIHCSTNTKIERRPPKTKWMVRVQIWATMSSLKKKEDT